MILMSLLLCNGFEDLGSWGLGVGKPPDLIDFTRY